MLPKSCKQNSGLKILIRFNSISFVKKGIGFIVTLTCIIYFNSFQNNFTNWDDNSLIVNNQSIHSLSFSNLKGLFVFQPGSTYQPLRNLSYAIDYYFWGLNPVGYHLQNVLWHCLAGVFIFLILLRVLPELIHFHEIGKQEHILRLIALYSALFFIAHPINVEAVTWLSGRKYTLMAFFFFGAFYFFVKPSIKTQKRIIYSIGSFLFYLFAIMSSPFAVVLPVLLFIYEYSISATNNPIIVFKKKWLSYILFIFFFIGAGLLLLKALVFTGVQGGAALKAHYYGNPIYTLMAMFRMLFEYGKNILLPFWLSCRYVDFIPDSFLEFQIVVSILGIFGLLCYTLFQMRRGNKVHLFCLLWIFIAWSPASNIIPISIKMADRYIYIASFGLFLWLQYGIYTGINYILTRFHISLPTTKVYGRIVSIMILLLGLLTIKQNMVWSNSIKLWQNAIKIEPTGIAHNNLGEAYYAKGDYWHAKKHFKNAADLLTRFLRDYEEKLNRRSATPLETINYAARNLNEAEFYEKVIINLGLCYHQLAELDRAIACFNEALALDPNNVGILHDLSLFLQEKGDITHANVYLEKALAIRPGKKDLLYQMSLCKARSGEFNTALVYFRKIPLVQRTVNQFLQLERIFFAREQYLKTREVLIEGVRTYPDNAILHKELAIVLTAMNETAGALLHYKEALRIDKNIEDAHFSYHLGLALMKSGAYDASIVRYQKVLQDNPNFIEAYNNLGNVYTKKGNFQKALKYFQEALNRDPKNLTALFNLGAVHFQMDHIHRAQNYFNRILELDAKNVHAIQALKMVKNKKKSAE